MPYAYYVGIFVAMEPYYLVPMFLKIHKMISICDTYTCILYVFFPNFSSHVHSRYKRLDRKLGTSFFHLFTQVLFYLNPKRCLRKEVPVALFF